MLNGIEKKKEFVYDIRLQGFEPGHLEDQFLFYRTLLITSLQLLLKLWQSDDLKANENPGQTNFPGLIGSRTITS